MGLDGVVAMKVDRTTNNHDYIAKRLFEFSIEKVLVCGREVGVRWCMTVVVFIETRGATHF